MRERKWTNKYKPVIQALIDYKKGEISIGRLAEILEIPFDDALDIIKELDLGE